MGVEGLAAFAKSRGVAGLLKKLALGKPIGIDASVWLYQCAAYLPADPTDPAWKRGAEMLAARAEAIVKGGVPVVVVFDCPHTSPAKAEERARRRAAREQASADVDGGPAQPAAGDWSGTVARPAMADVHCKLQTMVWEAMQQRGVTCLMSPAEADHQIVLLHVLGLIWAALTVDSDLLAMGVPCFVNYKARTGECLFIDVPFWRPIATWAEGEEDPLEWLVAAYRLGGDTRARSALMLYACIAHSDFNKIQQIGMSRAVALVRFALPEMPDYDVKGFRCWLENFAPGVSL